MTGSESARTRWGAVVAALVTGVITAFYIGKMPPALLLIQREFDVSLVAAGWMVSMFNVIASVGAIAFGVVSDRIGAFRFCALGLACIALGGIVGAVANSPVILLASRAIE